MARLPWTITIATRSPITEDKAFLSDLAQDHRHEVYLEDGEYVVSRPVEQLQARVPRYGKLSIRDRNGAEGKGIDVGKEWTYRKYIEGTTLSAAIWTFKGIHERNFNDELPLELTLAVFRTFKADMSIGVEGSIMFRNPGLNPEFRQTVPMTFRAKEFQVDRHFIPRTVKAVRESDGAVVEADLFNDLCDQEGNLEVWIRCEDEHQYFGVAQGDLYVLEAERPFGVNFVKGFLGIWMQTVLIVCFGVMVSARLNGAVSMLATVVYIVMGTFRESILGVFKGIWDNNQLLAGMFGKTGGEAKEILGGGPLESTIRILTQKNLTAELDMGWFAEGFISWVDVVLESMLLAVTHFAPDFASFDTASYLAEGYGHQWTCGRHPRLHLLHLCACDDISGIRPTENTGDCRNMMNTTLCTQSHLWRGDRRTALSPVLAGTTRHPSRRWG